MAFNAYGDAGSYVFASALSLGVALAILLRAFVSRSSKIRQDRYVSLSALFATLAAATLAVAVVRPEGLNLFLDGEFLIIAGCILMLGAVSCTFPRVMGFPAVIFLGVAIAVYSYLYLRLPAVADGKAVGTITNEPGGMKVINVSPGVPFGGTLRIASDEVVFIRYAEFIIDPRIPFIGGQKRGAIAGIRAESSEPSQSMFPWAENHPYFWTPSKTLPGVVAKTHETAIPAGSEHGPPRYVLRMVDAALHIETNSP